MTVGDRIKILRELFEISSNEFAEITGIHPVTIRKYETNKMQPSKEHIDKMCSALKLPRIIFEGIPEQYTNYDFLGDFYQELFLLLANGTIEYKSDESFYLNKKLDTYIQVEVNGKAVPIDQVSFSVKKEDNLLNYDNAWLHLYLEFKEKADSIKSKSQEKILHKEKLLSMAEEIQLKMMLYGRSWKQYMKGMGSHEESLKDIEKVLSEGGSFYDYVEKIDGPESLKNRLIKFYEEARIEEYISDNLEEYPYGKSEKEITGWIKKKIDLIDQYKKNHPNYKEEIRLEEKNKRSK